MNERIKELKHQASLWCDENIPEQYSHETGYGDAWEDKFAELLIKECTNMLPEDSIRNADGVHMFYVIREHFGVPVIGR